MPRHPDECITVPAPPESTPRLGRRIALSVRDVACGGFLVGIGLYAIMPRNPIEQYIPGTYTNCFGPPRLASMTRDDVAARLRTIQDLLLVEAAIRATLPRAQPGVIVPRNQEIYR